jgi:hypothetical protein
MLGHLDRAMLVKILVMLLALENGQKEAKKVIQKQSENNS